MGLLDQFTGLLGRQLGQLGPEVAPQLLQAAMSDSRFGGMAGLLQHLTNCGMADHVASWTDPNSPNQPVNPDQLKQVLGDNELTNIAGTLGVTPQAAADFLAKHLPGAAAAQAQSGEAPTSEPH